MKNYISVSKRSPLARLFVATNQTLLRFFANKKSDNAKRLWENLS